MPAGVPILEMKSIHKSFPGVKALSGVDFRLFKGEVHAVMGQNGAGKSTLVKVMTGVHRQDSGELLLEGRPIRPDSPLAAQRLGISTVYQEINLCPNLSVAENIFIGRQPRKLGRIDWKEMNRRARELLRRLNISIDVTQVLSSYSIAIQQMVAIARVLDISSKILILDEPTSSLDENEVGLLFSVIRSLRESGMAILFITHFLDQTYQISNRITILKNGTFVGEYATQGLPKLDLVAKMLGKELSEFDYASNGERKKRDLASAAHDAAPLLSVKELGLRGSVTPFSLNLYKGEVLGFAGLLGSGRTEIARLIFGIDRASQGEDRPEQPEKRHARRNRLLLRRPKERRDLFRAFRSREHHPGAAGEPRSPQVSLSTETTGNCRRANTVPRDHHTERKQRGWPTQRGEPAESDARSVARHPSHHPYPR
jgi:monosaccharide-transporting ATPase